MPLVRLYAPEDSIEAHLLRHMLEQQGIPVFIVGEHLDGAMGELPMGGMIEVLVPADWLDDANDVLEDFFERLDGDDASDDEDGSSDDDDPLLDEHGYYREDAEHEPPAHNDPENPWNAPYRKRRPRTPE